MRPAEQLRAQALQRLRRQRAVEQLCRIPRLVFELLDELDRHYDLGDELDQRIEKYATVDLAVLRALGGDRFSPLPLRPVPGRSRLDGGKP